MSLYLALFDSAGKEVDGWVVGHYSDFGAFREEISLHIPKADLPILMEHSDCDGEWASEVLPGLIQELRRIQGVLRSLPAKEIVGAFEHTAEFRAESNTLEGCFHNVDGEPLLQALIDLCERAFSSGCVIRFQ